MTCFTTSALSEDPSQLNCGQIDEDSSKDSLVERSSYTLMPWIRHSWNEKGLIYCLTIGVVLVLRLSVTNWKEHEHGTNFFLKNMLLYILWQLIKVIKIKGKTLQEGL